MLEYHVSFTNANFGKVNMYAWNAKDFQKAIIFNLKELY